MSGALAKGTGTHQLHGAADHVQRALLLCVLLSITAHVALLTMQLPSNRPSPAAHSVPQTGLRVRLVEKPPASRANPSPTIEPTTMPAPSSVPGTSRSHSDEMPRPARMAPTGVPAATETAPKPAVSDRNGIPIPTTSPTGHDEYLPRPLLTVAPVAQAPVIIASPPGEPAQGKVTGVLSLFIDEDGSVHHIAADEPRMPPAFELAARDAFMGAQFKPGELDGRVVKSRVRIEVIFDDTPLMRRQSPALK